MGTWSTIEFFDLTAIELEITFDAPQSRVFGVNVLSNLDGEEGFTISADARKEILTVGYSEPPFTLEDGEDLTLRVFIDKGMIEVFANDRQAAVAWHEYEPEDVHVSLFSKGGPVTVSELKAWRMKSAYSGN